jgi:Zinc carboxypeptidase
MDFEALFNQYKEPQLQGRYVSLQHIGPILERHSSHGEWSVIGRSVQDRSIYAYRIGNGKTKILMWSQMHGNESTTTKALFDFFNYLDGEGQPLLDDFSFLCLPMLNPDGAQVYTRENANGVDLNRDADQRTQPESIALRKAFDDFKPDFCYNLHDQRTIYGVADSGKPATVSFLAPAYNFERDINAVRYKAMHVISAMNEALQQYIPGQVGRFDDAFNINCVGDTFQFLGVPTILFEALLSGLQHINENVMVDNEIHDYLNIPQNKINFYDFVYKNIKINYDSNKIFANFAVQYKEALIDNQVCFNAYIAKIGAVEDCFGHIEYDAQGAEYSDNENNIPELEQAANFFLGETKIANGKVSGSL